MNRVSTRNDVLQSPAQAIKPAGKDPGKPQAALTHFEQYVLDKLNELDRSVRQDSLSTVSSPRVMEHLKRSKVEFLEAVIKAATFEMERLGRELPGRDDQK
jgi:hypothetical protein